MKNRSCILTLAAAASFAATAANCLDTTPVLDARPEYMKLHAKAIDLARRHVEKLDGWKPQLVCFPGVRTIWQWDSCLMALFAGYTPSGLDGLGNLDNLYGMQADDGFMAMAYNYDTRQPEWRGRINPPLFAWCEWLYARRTGDTGRLPRAYAVCTRYFRWLKENRTRRNGLYWFEDTGSSGMDNSPRSGYWAYDLKGSDVCFVDLCCQQVLAAKCLAKIASVLGKAGESAEWTREAGELAMKINRLMWCGKTGFYHDVFVDTNNKLAVKTAAAFWSLVSGVADGEKAVRLAAHLDNPDTFGSPNPVPSLSRDDPNYDPDGGYWLGGAWPPVVYMVCCGLRENGMRGLARSIAARHLDCMAAVMEAAGYGGTIWECYSPEHTAPATKYGGRLCRRDFVGWGGLGPLVMLVEDIIGLDVNALEGRIDWTVSEPGRQGLRDFPFNGGKVSLVADADPKTGVVAVEVESDRAFRLRIALPDGRVLVDREVHPGSGQRIESK